MFAFIHHVIEQSLSIYHVSGLCMAQVVKEKWSLEKGKRYRGGPVVHEVGMVGKKPGRCLEVLASGCEHLQNAGLSPARSDTTALLGMLEPFPFYG